LPFKGPSSVVPLPKNPIPTLPADQEHLEELPSMDTDMGGQVAGK